MNRFRTMQGYGQLPIPQMDPQGRVSPQLISSSVEPSEGPTYRYDGLVTYEKPIREFYPDIVIPVNAAGSVTTLRAGSELPNNCVGLRFINFTAGVQASINGGGMRTILANDTFEGCEIDSIVIYTDATGACTVQAVGTGD